LVSYINNNIIRNLMKKQQIRLSDIKIRYNYKWFIRKTVTLSATLYYLVTFKILFPEKIIFPFTGFHGKMLQTLIRFFSVKSIIFFSVSSSVTKLGTTLLALKAIAFLISLYKYMVLVL